MKREKANQVTRLLSLLVLLSLVLVPVSLVYADCTWTQQSPATSPSARSAHAMATIGGDQVLLFGGWEGGSPSNETWLYDLSDDAWTLQSPDIRPSARSSHAMATIGGDQVLLFGGWDDETWIYDLGDDTWTLQSPASSPPLRRNHAMAYLGGDQVLLFGGYESSGVDYGDTWIYDLSADTWTQQFPATSPSAREWHAMASIGEGQVLLFGGAESVFTLNDTWVYVLGENTWKLQSPAAQPSARRCHTMASIGGNQVLLFSGFIGASTRDNESWVYDLDDDTWTLQSPATQPSARTNHAMASIGAGQALLFGGDVDGGRDDETWLVTAAPPTAITLASFDATAIGSAILLDWETASELDNLGFNLYRAESLEGERVRLNAALVPSQNPGSPLGAAYTWLDEIPEAGNAAPGTTYHYWLEAVDVHGATTRYGPISAELMPLRRLLPTRPRLAPQPAGLHNR